MKTLVLSVWLATMALIGDASAVEVTVEIAGKRVTVSSLYSTALKRSDFRADLGPIFAITE